MLRQVGVGVWVGEHPQRLLGVEIGTRMTVIALRDGSLFVHAPVALDPETRSALDTLGPVRLVLAPNRFHHLYVGQYRAAYPAARLLAAPGLERKRADLAFDAIVGDAGLPELDGEVEHLVFRAAPILNEVVVYHRASRTLLLTDVVTNVCHPPSRGARLLFRANGALGRLCVGRFERALIRNRRLARETVERMLGWDFDCVIMAHGELLERGGHNAISDSFAWLG